MIPAMPCRCTRSQCFEKRPGATEERRRRAVARLRGQNPPRGVLERAKDLVAGGEVSAVDPLQKMRACDLEVLQDLDRRRLTTAAAGQLLAFPRRRRHDAVWPGTACPQHRHHLRQAVSGPVASTNWSSTWSTYAASGKSRACSSNR